MGAEVIEPEVDGGIKAPKIAVETMGGGILEVDGAAGDNTEGGEQPRLADEAPE